MSADAFADSAALRNAFCKKAAERFTEGMVRAAAALPNAGRSTINAKDNSQIFQIASGPS